ncbi:hypothetical protein MZK49_14330 [Ensifer sesbaniae]|jgi:hypothetical protein|uniref:hypothetical protein n=1 Tax=Ensifer sesbaniae TaxID=1214071 RepID=UPI001568DCD1|nr:hypothetical protein [Ensifer sesbaniae]MCK3777884.1 hypothetical protein [Ensifer sesbaniae]NRQ18044.1 hypothetical protein [Ensifer sesbaniae]
MAIRQPFQAAVAILAAIRRRASTTKHAPMIQRTATANLPEQELLDIVRQGSTKHEPPSGNA